MPIAAEITTTPELEKQETEKILSIFESGVLETFLDTGGIVGAPVFALMRREENGKIHLTFKIMDDAYSADDQGGLAGDPRAMQQLYNTSKDCGEVVMLAASGETYVGRVGQEVPNHGVFLASQTVDGETEAHVYLENPKDDPSGYFTEAKEISTVAVKAAKQIIGSLWKEYLLTKTLNS